MTGEPTDIVTGRTSAVVPGKTPDGAADVVTGMTTDVAGRSTAEVAGGRVPGAQDLPGRAAVLTVSTRAASGVYLDRSGPVLVEALRGLGLRVDGPTVVADGEPLGRLLPGVLAVGYDLVLTTGGTGLTPSDRTPEITRPLLDREVPGIAERIRAHGCEQGIVTAALSRGVAGLAGRTLVVNLPGSVNGCLDALAVLGPLLGHVVDQLRGGDHRIAPEHAAGGPATWDHAGRGRE